MKKKVVFFLPNLYGGGAERVSVNLLKQLDRYEYEIYLILVKKVGEYISDIPEYVKMIDLNANKTFLSLFKLRKILKNIEPDFVYSTLFRTSVALDLVLRTFLYSQKIKVIYRNPTSPKLVIEENSLNPVMKFLLEKAYQRADLIIAQTPEMKNELITYHKITSEQILILLNPIDEKNIDNSIKNIKNPFKENYINIVSAGRMSYEKGFDILLKAFHQVIQKNNKFRLHIIGKDGGEETNLKKLCKDLDLEYFVFFHGFQKNPYKYFYFSDFYVLSSRREGLPNTVLENLYLEKPIVATNCIPFMSQLIRDKENGYIVKVDDIDELAIAMLNYAKLNALPYTNSNGDINKILKKIDNMDIVTE